MDVLAASCKVAESDFPDQVAKLVKESKLAAEIETRGLTFVGWMHEFPLILDIYNDAWQNNWSSVPVSRAEAAMISHLMLPVSKPAWIRIARWRGEPVAVVAQIPDVNEALAPLHGRLLPFGWARLLTHIHWRGTQRTRIPMIGVAKRWRGTPVGSLAVRMLLAEAIEQAQKAGVVEAEISWMLENNRGILNLIAALPARHTRTFRIYEKDI
ncbi:MAG: GNAT family N-acetyltransferase [Methylovirgula sp.]